MTGAHNSFRSISACQFLLVPDHASRLLGAGKMAKGPGAAKIQGRDLPVETRVSPAPGKSHRSIR